MSSRTDSKLALPAVDNYWVFLVGVEAFDFLVAVDETGSEVWSATVRPSGEVVVVHQSLLVPLSTEEIPLYGIGEYNLC